MIRQIQSLLPQHPRCHRKHCDAWAKFVPVLRIPAVGCPIPEHEPLVVHIQIPLCEHHADSMKVGEFATKNMRRIVRGLCKEQRRAEPDFARAFMQKKPIGEDV